MSNKAIIKAALQAVIANVNGFSIEVIASYFSVNYHQNVNGNVLFYDDFVKHIAALYQVLKSVEITIIAMVQDGQTVFSHHHVHAKKYDGSEVHTQVIAQFTLQDGKIIQCDELTHLITGSDEDHDLGSRTR